MGKLKLKKRANMLKKLKIMKRPSNSTSRSKCPVTTTLKNSADSSVTKKSNSPQTTRRNKPSQPLSSEEDPKNVSSNNPSSSDDDDENDLYSLGPILLTERRSRGAPQTANNMITPKNRKKNKPVEDIKVASSSRSNSPPKSATAELKFVNKNSKKTSNRVIVMEKVVMNTTNSSAKVESSSSDDDEVTVDVVDKIDSIPTTTVTTPPASAAVTQVSFSAPSVKYVELVRPNRVIKLNTFEPMSVVYDFGRDVGIGQSSRTVVNGQSNNGGEMVKLPVVNVKCVEDAPTCHDQFILPRNYVK